MACMIRDPVVPQRLRQRLLGRIRKRYDILTEDVQLGQSTLSFTRIADPNRVLDQVAEEEDRREKLSGERRHGDALHLPYWAELWDSALGVAQYILRHGSDLIPVNPVAPRLDRPVRALDLGCGMGLTGTVAASVGMDVLFADLEPAALLFARLNSLPWRRRIRTRQLNWRTDRLGQRFDLIIGADILYERAQWEYLELFWREHLAPRGRVLLGEPGRATGDLFGDWIQRRRWRLTIQKEPVHTRSTPIRLFVLEEPR